MTPEAMMQRSIMVYQAMCEHSKVRAMTVDLPAHKKDTAKFLAQMVRHGLTIDRVTLEAARQADMCCDVCDAKRKANG